MVTSSRDDDGMHIAWAIPYLLALAGLPVSVATAPGTTSVVAALVTFVCVTIGAVHVGWRAASGVFILMICLVPAVMLAFLVFPLQDVSGWLTGLACDDTHPVLAPVVQHVAHNPKSTLKSTTLIAQACFTEQGGDPHLTFVPGFIWTGILLVWQFLALLAGIFAFAIRHPEQALAAGRPRR
jgi:hypothetical protein